MEKMLKITLTKNVNIQIIFHYLSFFVSLLLLSLSFLCFSIFPKAFIDNTIELFLGILIFMFILVSSYNFIKTIRNIQKLPYILKIDSNGFRSSYSSDNLVLWNEILSIEISNSQKRLKGLAGCYFNFLNITTKNNKIIAVPYALLLPVGYTTQTYSNLLYNNFKIIVCTTFYDIISKNNIEIIYDDIRNKRTFKSSN